MIPSKVYSKALYALAEEIDKNEGCVTCSSVLVEGAAERIDTQTLTIRGLEIQRDELLAALEQFATWGRMQHKAQSKGGHATFDMLSLKDEIDLAEAAIASVKGQSA